MTRFRKVWDRAGTIDFYEHDDRYARRAIDDVTRPPTLFDVCCYVALCVGAMGVVSGLCAELLRLSEQPSTSCGCDGVRSGAKGSAAEEGEKIIR